ncbi:hypothetical protein Tco_0867837 [Tanacetum coccineum]
MHCGEDEEEEQTFARYLASLRTKCWKNSIGKLQPRAGGPFQVLKRINDNTYKIDLPSTYNVSATFNVADLSTYVTSSADDEDEEIRDVEQDSRANLFQAREHSARRHVVFCLHPSKERIESNSLFNASIRGGVGWRVGRGREWVAERLGLWGVRVSVPGRACRSGLVGGLGVEGGVDTELTEGNYGLGLVWVELCPASHVRVEDTTLDRRMGVCHPPCPAPPLLSRAVMATGQPSSLGRVVPEFKAIVYRAAVRGEASHVEGGPGGGWVGPPVGARRWGWGSGSVTRWFASEGITMCGV